MLKKCNPRVCVLQPVDSAGLNCSLGALQQDLEELKSVNASLRKENQSLREQLTRTGNSNKKRDYYGSSNDIL